MMRRGSDCATAVCVAAEDFRWEAIAYLPSEMHARLAGRHMFLDFRSGAATEAPQWLVFSNIGEAREKTSGVRRREPSSHRHNVAGQLSVFHQRQNVGRH